MTSKLPHLKKLGIALLLAVLIIAGFFYWYSKKYYPATDNAYVQANIISIAAQISGPVTEVLVQDHQFVKAGQCLLTIDARPFQLALAKAQAQAELLQKQAQRTLTLVHSKQLSLASGDDIRAQLRIAQAELGQAELNLQHTQICAPASGQISNFTLRPGTMITAGTPLFALIDDSHWWVDANYKETDLVRIRPGQPAKVNIDIYPGQDFQGVVQAISGGSGAAFSLFPPENATGNWVKVTQRFPVKILLNKPNSHYPLRVGASSTVSINTLS